MKAKIDLEKFISSMLGYAEDNCEETMLDYLHSALQDQGLEYKDGEIVEIAQESRDDRIRKEIIQYIKDTNKSGYLYDEEWIVWLEKREDKPTIRERYENRGTYVPTTIYKNPLDLDSNTLGGWETWASTCTTTDDKNIKIQEDEISESKS